MLLDMLLTVKFMCVIVVGVVGYRPNEIDAEICFGAYFPSIITQI